MVAEGDRLRRNGCVERAIEAYLSAVPETEIPTAALCLRLARAYQALGEPAEVVRWAMKVSAAGDDFTAWFSAAQLLEGIDPGTLELRRVRLTLLGSYTTGQLVSLLRLAALNYRIWLDIEESPYGQYRQQVLDPGSELYSSGCDVVLLAAHTGEVALPEHSNSPEEQVEAEVRRWTALWDVIAARSTARIIQHNFPLPPEVPLGHLSTRVAGSRYRMLRRLNDRLGDEANGRVAVVDCERLAGWAGSRGWFDPRYWYKSKQAVGLHALPLLARHTAAVLAADRGLTRKCLVLDLDNTLWGGIIGEDGLAGIQLGSGAVGEAFVAFQAYIRKLKERGVILAVCSKNNEADAREPFERHPEMQLNLDDISVFVANWDAKAEGIRSVARTLNIGLDSLVFVDDNPVERQAIREFLPEVDVVAMPADPALYVQCLSEYLGFETSSVTSEDRLRTEQYRARAQLAQLEESTSSLEDFYRGLQMRAVIQPFNDIDLPRIAQLIGKSNQFNVTTRRHGLAQLGRFRTDPGCVSFSLRLRDRFADHGLVSVMIACMNGDVLDIDTWLMSCRVIGRTVETAMLQYLCRQAEGLDCTMLQGTYIPTAKNQMVQDVFERFGFDLYDDAADGTTAWRYDISVKGPIDNEFIAFETPEPVELTSE